MEDSEQDEDVRMAIAALGSLRSSTTTSTSTTTATSARPGRPNDMTLPSISTLLSEHHPHTSYSHPSQSSVSTSASSCSPSSPTSYYPASSSRTSLQIHSNDGDHTHHKRSPYLDGATEGQQEEEAMMMAGEGEEGFIGRVSQLPLVSGALSFYERGRNLTRVTKYSTDLVESSVRTIGKPVINRVVGPNLAGQLDDFACRQLDRFGSSPRAQDGQLPPPAGLHRSDSNQSASTQRQAGSSSSYFPPPEAYYRRPHGKGRAHPDDDLRDDASSISPTSETPTLASGYSHASSALPTERQLAEYQHQQQYPYQQQQAVVHRSAASTTPRSRWQNLVIEAGVTAGGIGAAVSEESMKSLKYCLHWLHYATAHLDHQIGILKDFILSLSPEHRAALNGGRQYALTRGGEDPRAAEMLSNIKRDVVDTIRKVVDVVSTYAGSALPEQAKRYVRSSILGLPEKWARAMAGQEQQQMQMIEGDSQSSLQVNGHEQSQQLGDGRRPPLSTTEAAAERTLTFAVESLDMLRGVLSIFNDSVDRADAWVERLRIVGLQRQHALQRHRQQGTQLSHPSISNSGPVTSPRALEATALPGSSAQRNGLKRRDGESVDREMEDGTDVQQRRKNSRTGEAREGERTPTMELDQ